MDQSAQHPCSGVPACWIQRHERDLIQLQRHRAVPTPLHRIGDGESAAAVLICNSTRWSSSEKGIITRSQCRRPASYPRILDPRPSTPPGEGLEGGEGCRLDAATGPTGQLEKRLIAVDPPGRPIVAAPCLRTPDRCPLYHYCYPSFCSHTGKRQPCCPVAATYRTALIAAVE